MIFNSARADSLHRSFRAIEVPGSGIAAPGGSGAPRPQRSGEVRRTNPGEKRRTSWNDPLLALNAPLPLGLFSV